MELCKLFGCPPSVVLNEDASVIRYLKIMQLAPPPPEEGADDYGIE